MSALIELKQQGKIQTVVFLIFPRPVGRNAQYGRIDSLQPPYSLSGGRWKLTLCHIASKNNISILPTLLSQVVDWEI